MLFKKKANFLTILHLWQGHTYFFRRRSPSLATKVVDYIHYISCFTNFFGVSQCLIMAQMVNNPINLIEASDLKALHLGKSLKYWIQLDTRPRFFSGLSTDLCAKSRQDVTHNNVPFFLEPCYFSLGICC